MTKKTIKELINIIEYCLEKNKVSNLEEALEILYDALEECDYGSDDYEDQ